MAAVLIGAAACSDDDDDAGPEPASDEAAYVEAFADAAGLTGNLSRDEARCFAQSYIGVAGLEALQEAFTPEEIRSGRGLDGLNGLSQSLDEGQQVAVVDSLRGCMDLGAMIAYNFAALVGDEDLAAAGPCLEQGLDDPALGPVVAPIMAGAVQQFDPEQAEAYVGWLGGCIDLRKALITRPADGDATVEACLDAGLTDEMAHRYWVETMVDPDAPDGGETARVIQALIDDCQAQGGA